MTLSFPPGNIDTANLLKRSDDRLLDDGLVGLSLLQATSNKVAAAKKR
jgi:hypothetical protein